MSRDYHSNAPTAQKRVERPSWAGHKEVWSLLIPPKIARGAATLPHREQLQLQLPHREQLQLQLAHREQLQLAGNSSQGIASSQGTALLLCTCAGAIKRSSHVSVIVLLYHWPQLFLHSAVRTVCVCVSICNCFLLYIYMRIYFYHTYLQAKRSCRRLWQKEHLFCTVQRVSESRVTHRY